MPQDILPTKPELPNNFIDLSVGEPYIVREELKNYFGLDEIRIAIKTDDFVYPDPSGYRPLVKLLEEKYRASVIIVSGAKQGLAASFYALKKLGYDLLGTRKPYWALIPPLMDMFNLKLFEDNDEYKNDVLARTAHLLVAPNNPDGYCPSDDFILKVNDYCKKGGMPLIHDGAYYNHIYLPKEYKLNSIGDVQIFSMSKGLGLSGLRCGYVVCHNPKFYDLIKYYIDQTTVGVSLASQTILYDILMRMRMEPELTAEFEDKCRERLLRNKELLLEVNPEVLEIPKNIKDLCGMFLFSKVGNKADFNKSKLNFVDGKPFGMPGYVRMNLSFSEDKIKEIINRLNSVV